MADEGLKDKELKCVDCDDPFVFTVGEQEFYLDKGFENDPKRCQPCRAKKKERKQQGGDRR